MILDFLRCVDQNKGKIPEMKNCIHNYLERLTNKKRNIRSDVYGIALPSLRKLKLIVGRGKLLQLNSNGLLLLTSFSSGGKIEFEFQFGYILYQLDKKNGRIIDCLLEETEKEEEKNITYQQLVTNLLHKKVETSKEDERLKKWLAYLEYVNIIQINGDSIRLNQTLIATYRSNKRFPPLNIFEDFFFAEYKKLENNEGIYVPIYQLIMNVCFKLITEGYPFTTFDCERGLEYLLKRYSSLEKKKIILSEPGKREEEGIYVGNSYYYYISIYDVEEK